MKKTLSLFILIIAFSNCSTDNKLDETEKIKKEVQQDEHQSFESNSDKYVEPPTKKINLEQNETKQDDWGDDYINQFMSACSNGIKSSGAPISDSDILKICECELAKIREVYPNPNLRFDPQVLTRVEEECGREVLDL